MSVYGPNGDLNAATSLAGPGSTGYVSDAYGYSYAQESDDGRIDVHTVYAESGVSTDYHAYSYHGESYGYARESVYRSYASPSYASASGYSPGPYSAAYGYETSTYQSLSLTETLDGTDIDQVKSSSVYRAFSSGYSTTYAETGTSTFEDGAFVTGSATHYSVYSVTNPYGYETSTPSYQTY